jgi:hypothetical protein
MREVLPVWRGPRRKKDFLLSISGRFNNLSI